MSNIFISLSTVVIFVKNMRHTSSVITVNLLQNFILLLKCTTITFYLCHIAEVPIVSTKYPVFPSAQVNASLSSIYTSRKISPIASVTVVVTISPVDILTRRPIDKEK